ncbi:MAG: GNAT family N-acetyltransferase [Cyanobacteria bacterium SZAS LIN-5]|nr:GNAT family N-acetyltransferase [Cyanobacteria bacterium SZAS LIN-5]
MISSACSSDLQVREAEQGEWQAIVDLTVAAYSQYEAAADSKFWQHYQANIKSTILSSTDISRLVAVKNGEILASAIYCFPAKKVMGGRVVSNAYPEMRLLSVSPSHRNEGLGTVLIDACERLARESGYSAITLHTTQLMTVARNMYERRGYVRFEEIDFEPAPGFLVWGYIKGLDSNE